MHRLHRVGHRRELLKSAADATADADTLHVAELPEVAATEKQQADLESSNEPGLFEVDEEVAARMEALLRAAEQQAMMDTENTSLSRLNLSVCCGG